MPAYVNFTHKTFVCTKCSAYHRMLQFKVKGISMTIFTDDDVKLMESGGNGPFNALYMARYVPGKDMPIPNGNDANRMKEFITMKYNKKWYSSEGASGASDFGSDNFNERRTSFPSAQSNPSQTRRSSGGGDGMDLLDMLDSAPPPSVFSPSSNQQKSNNFDAFGGSSNNNSNSNASSKGFDAFGQPSSNGNGFNAFSSSSAPSSNSFDAFSSSSQQSQSFDNFGQQMTFQQPQMQNQAFAQPQGGFMNQAATNFGQTAAPMAFIKIAPPAPAPAPIAPLTSAPSKPVIPGFAAFDDLVIESPAMPPAPAPNTANPFDMPGNGAGQPMHNSFNGGPPQQQYGMPPQPQYGMPPQQQYGMPQQQQFGVPPQQQFGMPPQQQYGMPPQQQFGMPTQQQFGMPTQQQYGMPPQQQYGMSQGAPYQATYNPNMGAPPQAQPQLVSAPATAPQAPDPFLSMTGLAFETVGKAPPPRSSISVTPSDIAVQQSMPNPPPVAATPEISANPFDMF